MSSRNQAATHDALLLIPELVSVPGGPFVRGTSDADIEWLLPHTTWATAWQAEDLFKDEQPQQTINLPAFDIGRYPVTNREYEAFVVAANHAPPSHWRAKTAPEPLARHPVVFVSLKDALAYCRWLSQHTGQPFRLPTEMEWEKAARGPDGRWYPWGNTFDAARCNHEDNGPATTTPVEQFSPLGDSPYGCADMAGNVWEWCSTPWAESYISLAYGSNRPEGKTNRIVRGGSWHSGPGYLRCAYRLRPGPRSGHYDIGFRVVLPHPSSV